MKDDKFREQRNSIIAFLERMPLYSLFAIENLSSDVHIQQRYVTEVKNTDLVLLILQTDLREGVANEFYAAKRNQKRIFTFIHEGKKSKQLKEFIDQEVNNYLTSTQFKDNRDLIDKIEATLLEDLVEKYVRLYEENLMLHGELKKISQRQEF
ncbi:hypothetical protein [Gottfriedia solisilvae]|nr:hypothetical protein [Gottfriedia solisilvae]